MSQNKIGRQKSLRTQKRTDGSHYGAVRSIPHRRRVPLWLRSFSEADQPRKSRVCVDAIDHFEAAPIGSPAMTSISVPDTARLAIDGGPWSCYRLTMVDELLQPEFKGN